MPLTLPSELIAEKNKLYSSGAFIELLEVVLSEDSSTMRLANNNDDVVWNSNTWNKFSFVPGDFEEADDDEAASVQIKVSNVGRVVQGWIEAATTDNLIGDTVNYYLVHSDNLDKGAAITMNFIIIEIECNEEWAVFTLGMENFFFRRFPLNIYRRNLCRYKVFKGTECLYAGADLTCDRTFKQCLGFGHQLRFGGQPGIPGGQFNVT